MVFDPFLVQQAQISQCVQQSVLKAETLDEAFQVHVRQKLASSCV